jgi:phosphatidylglycerophosphatase A
VFSLLKWSALVLLILGICLFLVVDTVKRVMFAEAKERSSRTVMMDVLAVGLVLFLYYVVVSGALLLFFNVLLPVAESL